MGRPVTLENLTNRESLWIVGIHQYGGNLSLAIAAGALRAAERDFDPSEHP